MKKNIAIIGCGYIGSEIASVWSQKGFHVTATTRHAERLPELSKVAQKALILKGNDEEEFASLIANHEVLVVTVAPGSSDLYESTYLHTANLFRHLALEMDVSRHLIYTSSTSVYGDHHGLWVDETSELHSKSEPGKILIETEKVFLSLHDLGWHTCILRLAEIYGPERELSKRVKAAEGHHLPGTGEQYTNMIHKHDAAAALDYALRHHLEGIYNIADDDHPTREELYNHIADKFHLRVPHWDPQMTGLHSANKRVSNHKIKSEGFTLRHPHRILD